MVSAVEAGIVALLNFCSVQHFHTRNERAVNESTPAFRDLETVAEWLL
jgi:hypothetical protein